MCTSSNKYDYNGRNLNLGVKKNMCKLPNIIIYELELIEKGYEDFPQHFYFLTKGGLKRFVKRNKLEENNKNYIWSWGGVQLWLW